MTNIAQISSNLPFPEEQITSKVPGILPSPPKKKELRERDSIEGMEVLAYFFCLSPELSALLKYRLRARFLDIPNLRRIREWICTDISGVGIISLCSILTLPLSVPIHGQMAMVGMYSQQACL